MPWIIGTAIAGGALLSGGIQLWANESAKDEARREHRRAERLNLKIHEQGRQDQLRKFEWEKEKYDQKFNFETAMAKFDVRDKFRNNIMSMAMAGRNSFMQMQKYKSSKGRRR